MELYDRLKDYFKESPYSFVILFGSYAKGTANAASDVDIGVYFDGEADLLDMGYRSEILGSIVDKKIDMIALNDIPRKNPLLAFEILDNHTPLLVNNEDDYINFKTASQLSYLDHLDLIESNRNALLGRLRENKFGDRNFVTEN